MALTAETDAAGARSHENSRRSLIASSIGNLLEWYDFAAYGYMAVVMGSLFFPSGSEATSLLLSFATFGVAFAIRPLGGAIIGPLGDKIGRRTVLCIVVLGISAATFAMGLLPTYASIGIVAPILLVLLRMVQGFCAGGEVGGAITFVAEAAPTARRGYYASWIQSSAVLGFFLGLSTPTVLSAVLPGDALESWAWRVPFLVAGPLGLIGLYIRLKLEETPNFKELEESGKVADSVTREVFGRSWGNIFLAAGIGIPLQMGYFMILTYVPSYLKTALDYSSTTAYFATGTAIVADLLVIPFAAVLSDRVGRKPGMLVAAIAFVVGAVPLFMMIQGGGIPAFVALGILGALHGVYLGFCGAALAEIFATRNRYGGLSVGHNIGAAVFGGATPFMATFLVDRTGNNLMPAFLILGCCLLSLVAIFAMKDRAGQPLVQE
ncbi:MFS transporter [Actinomadura rugatobispora]|uniref:MFS transporter n=1 Tax=Actinomadura rugatobispora TaxID=1994 RepID=A0ABW0ZVA4_9ACTN|nr:MFS transporter [Actinomadura rugatobispora]